MKDNPPNDVDYPTLHRLERVGIVVGNSIDLNAAPPAIKGAVERGTTDAKKLLAEDVTAYDAEGFFIPNAIERQAIGDRDKLVPNADGSLDLISKRSRRDATRRGTGCRLERSLQPADAPLLAEDRIA